MTTQPLADTCIPAEASAVAAGSAASVRTEAGAAERVYILDGLRFIAAFGVFLYHITYRAPEIDHLTGAPFPEWSGWTRYLHLGVQLFFMISGFVIFWSAEGKTAKQFVWSRFVRLYPAFWVCCTLTFLVCHHWWRPYFDLGVGDWLVNMTMFQQFIHVPSVDAPYWTLTEELRFYMLTCLLLLIRQQHRRLTFVAVWMGMSLFDFYVHKIPLARYEMTLQWAPMFASGIVYYDIFKRGPHTGNLLLLPVCFLTGLMRFLAWEANDGKSGAVCDPGVIACIFVGMHGIFALIALRKLVIPRRLAWLTTLGALTYPLYLIHNRIGITIATALTPAAGRWGDLLLTLAFSLSVAYFIAFWIEAPARRFLLGWGRRRGL